VILVDTGFLYALVDAGDRWHERALSFRDSVAEGWVTTWPVITEACWLLANRIGPAVAADLIDDAASGVFLVWDLPAEQLPEAARLMRRYADLPMDFADASLVLLAGQLGDGRILSTDERDFRTYRWKSRKPFQNLLSP
jgi:predicted nucleic acid-binding protein